MISNRDRVSLAQYENLRKHFNKMVTDVLGENYYNMAMDVYNSDRICCEDMTKKLKKKSLFGLFSFFRRKK